VFLHDLCKRVCKNRIDLGFHSRIRGDRITLRQFAFIASRVGQFIDGIVKGRDVRGIGIAKPFVQAGIRLRDLAAAAGRQHERHRQAQNWKSLFH